MDWVSVGDQEGSESSPHSTRQPGRVRITNTTIAILLLSTDTAEQSWITITERSCFLAGAPHSHSHTHTQAREHTHTYIYPHKVYTLTVSHAQTHIYIYIHMYIYTHAHRLIHTHRLLPFCRHISPSFKASSNICCFLMNYMTKPTN